MKNLLTQNEVKFWMGIGGVVVACTLAFANIKGGQDLLIQKVDTLNKSQEQQYAMWLRMEQRIGTSEVSLAEQKVKITAIETANNLRK
jgi:hypothetical protein